MKCLMILVLVSFALCCSSCSQLPCKGGGTLKGEFRGFDSAALEKVTLSIYPEKSGFTGTPIETTDYYLSKYAQVIKRYDTVKGYVY